MNFNIGETVKIVPVEDDDYGNYGEADYKSYAKEHAGKVGRVYQIREGDKPNHSPLYFVEGCGGLGFYPDELQRINEVGSPGTLTFAEYFVKSCETIIYPDPGDNLVYPALKLAGEAGEVAEKVGKMLRDSGYLPHNRQQLSELDTEKLAKEIGDVLWYCAAMAMEIGMSLEDIARMNIDKLVSRKVRGTLQGSGDER